VRREPSLSVVMCNYNHGHYLTDSLLAILEQSRPADEVIIVDDASTDDSVEIIEKIRLDHPELVLIRNKENRGVTATVTRGLKHATGDYVYTAAADDRVYPGFFEAAMKALATVPDAGLCYGRNAVIDWRTGDSQLGGRVFVPDGFYPPAKLVALVRRGFSAGGMTAMVRRTALDEAGGFLPELRYYNDWFALQVVAYRYGVQSLAQVVAACRHMPTSYSHAAPRSEKRETLKILFGLLETPAYADVSPMFKKGAFRSLRWEGARYILFKPRNWRWISVPYLKLLVFDLIASSVPDPVRQKVRHRWIATAATREASAPTGAAAPEDIS
jgi:glycosyltransferase involved in cell wall biosynthesis